MDPKNRNRHQKIAKRFVISGRVQGVGFRYFAQSWANQLGICGYVKNLWSGNVEVYAVGDPVPMEEFKRQLAEGPRMARVKNFEEMDEPVEEGYTRFEID
jgi:acylphosphatase